MNFKEHSVIPSQLQILITCTYLQGKQDDGDESDPAVQAVQVGYWGVLQVVGIKGSLQPDPSKDKHHPLNYAMDCFQVCLLRIPKHSVSQNSCQTK